MFKRRVGVLLVIMLLTSFVLLARAAQVQVLQRGTWESFLSDELSRSMLTATTRGRIVDRNGVVLAKDGPEMDAAIDYRVLGVEPDEQWLKWRAYNRLKRDPDRWRQYLDADREQRKALWDAEKNLLRDDLDDMWDILASATDTSRQEIDDQRRLILGKVHARRDFIARANHRRAYSEWEATEPPAWWRRWLLGENHEPPLLEDFDEEIDEEIQHHVVVEAIPEPARVELARQLRRFEGALILQTTQRRVYPFGDIAAHAIGRLGQVGPADLASDPETGERRRRYFQNDQIGKAGLERIAERRLRGTRGIVVRELGDNAWELADETEALAGHDVRTTLDIGFSEDIQRAFETITADIITTNAEGKSGYFTRQPAPGAAVVIDVNSGDLLALVNYPSYDLNLYEEQFPKLMRDTVNVPLYNRATQFDTTPGSTMKPLTGMAGILEGVVTTEDRILCDGFLHIDGRTYTHIGRCWIMRRYNATHDQNGANPPGVDFTHLDYRTAIERSCNVYFETVGDRLGLKGLDRWQRAFGLGQTVGIGLPETAGRTSAMFNGPDAERRSESWFNGIGQGQVQVTPIQMANVAATIARNGVWVKPKLLPDAPTDRRRLPLDPAAVLAAQRGMVDVMHNRTGTARKVGERLEDAGLTFKIAGKTGSASSAKLTAPILGPDGRPLLDENGKPAIQTFAFANDGGPVAWYHRDSQRPDDDDPSSHSWFIGFAPADDPQIAFCVMVQYGGSGSRAAGDVVEVLLKSAVERGLIDP
ncbi:MAG: penicillin-binding transpeptidase domain-containing protein [Planctomycetota bacterium]